LGISSGRDNQYKYKGFIIEKHKTFLVGRKKDEKTEKIDVGVGDDHGFYGHGHVFSGTGSCRRPEPDTAC
jgi:biotin synthase-related radical SAM superfamily protein